MHGSKSAACSVRASYGGMRHALDQRIAPGARHEQRGRRPVLVVSVNALLTSLGIERGESFACR
jgi:hypothetical protein